MIDPLHARVIFADRIYGDACEKSFAAMWHDDRRPVIGILLMVSQRYVKYTEALSDEASAKIPFRTDRCLYDRAREVLVKAVKSP